MILLILLLIIYYYRIQSGSAVIFFIFWVGIFQVWDSTESIKKQTLAI